MYDDVYVVRQLEQQVRNILDAIAVDETRKRELIRGEAVDKAEQLGEWRGGGDVHTTQHGGSGGEREREMHREGKTFKSPSLLTATVH